MDQRTYFQGNPTRLDISRSKFSLNHKFTTTAVAGRLQPCIAYPDILPGDTFKLDLSFVCRSTTPVAPTMDDQEIQIEFYFVPHKLVLSRAFMSPSINDAAHSFAAFIGAQDSLLNMPLPAQVMMPNLNLPFDKNRAVLNADGPGALGSTEINSWEIDSCLSQLDYPIDPAADGTGTRDSISKYFISPIPLLAFYSVWNENYRDPNLHNPVVFSVNANANSVTGTEISFARNVAAGIFSDSGWTGYGFPVVCAYHGYFGSCLPWPQRNSTQVQVPLGSLAPVTTLDVAQTWDSSHQREPIHYKWVDGGTYGHGTTLGFGINTNGIQGRMTGGGDAGTVSIDVAPSNLYADLAHAVGPSVNVLRLAIQTQRLFEAWARGGNRIQDMTQIFGVVPHDAADDKPEFLGGKRIPINISQVNQTAPGTSPVGTTGAFSNTSDSSHYFTKSFDTWGTLIGVYCIRHKDTFANMLPKYLTRKTRLDYYWPQFANLGEQPVNMGEKYFTNVVATDESVFGYQEYAAEYRMLSDRIAGAVSPIASLGQAYWTYAAAHTESDLEKYLNAYRMKAETDQTLAVQSAAAGFQYLIQFYFDITAVRPMPAYSIPGLLDHH